MISIFGNWNVNETNRKKKKQKKSKHVEHRRWMRIAKKIAHSKWYEWYSLSQLHWSETLRRKNDLKKSWKRKRKIKKTKHKKWDNCNLYNNLKKNEIFVIKSGKMKRKKKINKIKRVINYIVYSYQTLFICLRSLFKTLFIIIFFLSSKSKNLVLVFSNYCFFLL